MLYSGNNKGTDALIVSIRPSAGGIVLAQKAVHLPLSTSVKKEEKVHKRKPSCSGPC